MTHIDDTTLALVADDGGLPDDDPRHLHLAGCAQCQERLRQLTALRMDLRSTTPPLLTSAASVLPGVEARLARPPWHAGWRLPAMAGGLAAAALLLVVPGPAVDGRHGAEDLRVGLTPRGAPQPPTLRLIVDDTALVPPAPDDALATVATNATWRADIQLPRDGTRAVVVAVDEHDHVHWLRPAWVDADQPPACPAAGGGPRVIGEETVVLPLHPGQLDIRLYEVPAEIPCAVPTADEALAAGRLPPSWQLVDRQRVQVQP